MDNNRSPPFYLSNENPDSPQKKHLFSNRTNLSETYPGMENYLNGENTNTYILERSTKLWNHINTKPYSAKNHITRYLSKDKLEGATIGTYKEYVHKVVGEHKSENLGGDKVETISDIFSETEDNVSILSRLHSLTLKKSTSFLDQVKPNKSVQDETNKLLEQNDNSEINCPDQEQVEKKYEEVKDNDVLKPLYSVDNAEEKPNYQVSTVNNVKIEIQNEANSVTTSDTVKIHSDIMYRIDDANKVKIGEKNKDVASVGDISVNIALSPTVSENNPFDVQNIVSTQVPSKHEVYRDRKLFNRSTYIDNEVQKQYNRSYAYSTRVTNFHSSEMINYSNYIDYNPFSIFSVKENSGNELVKESDLKKLRTVILSSSHSEETLIKYFTEAICITNTHMMSQIIEFLVTFLRETHKIRQFVVRLMLCALSFHPEEFVNLFKADYLNVLFTPVIDDSIGVYFLKLLLSYKSTFGSRSEISTNIPYSINSQGLLMYSSNQELINTPRDTFISGKIETLYILKILLERSKASTVYSIPNSMLREQLCMLWYDMPKTIPNVNIIEVLLHWINSKEDLETKKYPFLLLEKVRDQHPFPNGQTIILSQFFMFALNHKANVNNHLEYVITIASSDSNPNESANVSKNNSIRRESMISSKNSFIKNSSRNSFVGLIRDENILETVLYRILYNFNERDLLDLWCLICVIPWKVTSPSSPFSRLFVYTLNTILKLTSMSYDNYPSMINETKIRLDIMENCLRICLARCSCPINSLNSLLQTTLLLNPESYRNESIQGITKGPGENIIISTLYKNGMILNSLCNFLWKCHFLWTRIKEGVNMEVVIVVTELYKILGNFTSVKPLDDTHLYNSVSNTNSGEMYKFFNDSANKGIWTKITTFIPQINLEQYFNTRELNGSEQYYQDMEEQEQNYDTFNETGRDDYMVYNEDELIDTGQVVGLKNLGNSCYLNSLLQSLCHTKLENNESNKMVNSLVKLFRKMKTTTKRSVSPKNVFKMMSENLTNSQQDVTEAIRYISQAIDPNLELWKSVFAGLVVRRIKCLRCESSSDNEEIIYDFSLSLNKARSVQKMLDNFSKVETLSGDNKYFCINCNKDVKAHMWNIIASPPSHLIIILNRNNWSYNETQKVLKAVKIDSHLFIEGFQYRLYGSIIHSGDSTDSGHYYFIGCDSEIFENWNKVDDSVVKPVHEFAVDDLSRDPSNTHVPYVLFYRCLQAPQTPKF
ncbi:ubiquitin carboxyl-terminal hydrolase, putative [Theileria annulata]|uniref:Ubiquitin carboxyl-terminal hydrolase, putative n=1 Tax=Theileria annulata TaxID=5874 RepID=Q4UBA6_THEAN|nr:ubiquitin carboxyl-terminal hydrolase, putative [Theileria annulata]CAI75895.1 ubiquitin carboxyl-terminal hydrolase, putative [Theileria annulata]|eukprot:XP_955371.1 ubiquitin carboxyl-terminal hydrolase, putative [Theileria annulata]